jgi:hypothetical protein
LTVAAEWPLAHIHGLSAGATHTLKMRPNDNAAFEHVVIVIAPLAG